MKVKDEIMQRFDLTAFTMPPEFYSDEEKLDRENKLLLCRLYIDSYKVLKFEEFSAIQGLLIVVSCWDETARNPEHISGGMFHTYNEMNLDMKLVSKILNTDMEKMVALLKSAFTKLPILRTMVPNGLLQEIDKMRTMPLKDTTPGIIDKDNFEKIGLCMRKNLYRSDSGNIMFRNQSKYLVTSDD